MIGVFDWPAQPQQLKRWRKKNSVESKRSKDEMKTKCIKSLDSESSTWLATQTQSVKLFPREKERNPRSYTRVQEREFSCQWIKEVVEKAWTVPSKHQYVKSNPHPESQRERDIQRMRIISFFLSEILKDDETCRSVNGKTATIFMNPAFLHPKSWDPRSPKTQKPEKDELFQFHRERERERVCVCVCVCERGQRCKIYVLKRAASREKLRERERRKKDSNGVWLIQQQKTKVVSKWQVWFNIGNVTITQKSKSLKKKIQKQKSTGNIQREREK